VKLAHSPSTPRILPPSSPPLLASLLFERFAPGEMHEALAGDLQEEFSHGRGRPWYWRQVLSAIFIGQSTQLRANWTAFLFAALWSAISPSLLFFEVHFVENENLMERIRQLASPWFTVCKEAIEVSAFFFILWIGLALYVSLHAWATRRGSMRRFARALLLTIPLFLRVWMAVAAITVLLAMAFPQRIFDLDRPRATLLQLIIAMAFSPATVVTFCTMVPSLCSSLPDRRSRRKSRVG